MVGRPGNSCASVARSPLLGKVADDAPIPLHWEEAAGSVPVDFSVSCSHSAWRLQQSGPTSNAGSSQEQWQEVVLFWDTSEASLTDSSQIIGRWAIPGI